MGKITSYINNSTKYFAAMDIENSSMSIKLPKSPLKINKSTMKSKKNLVVKKTIVPKVPRQSVETTTA